MDLLEDIDDPSIPLVQASNALGVSRATLYRRTMLPTPPMVRVRAPSPRRLGDSERKAVLDVLHAEPFADQPPPEIYAALLSQGVYLASIRTMYRLLAEQGESAERRAQRAPTRHVEPTLTATAPKEVWTWDISVPQQAAYSGRSGHLFRWHPATRFGHPATRSGAPGRDRSEATTPSGSGEARRSGEAWMITLSLP